MIRAIWSFCVTAGLQTSRALSRASRSKIKSIANSDIRGDDSFVCRQHRARRRAAASSIWITSPTSFPTSTGRRWRLKARLPLTPFGAIARARTGRPARPPAPAIAHDVHARLCQCLTPTADTPAANWLRWRSSAMWTAFDCVGTAAPARPCQAYSARFRADRLMPRRRSIFGGEILHASPWSGTAADDSRPKQLASITAASRMAAATADACQSSQALTAVIVCVEPRASRATLRAILGLKAAGAGDSWRLDTARGRLLFSTDGDQARNIDAPTLPWLPATCSRAATSPRRARTLWHRLRHVSLTEALICAAAAECRRHHCVRARNGAPFEFNLHAV